MNKRPIPGNKYIWIKPFGNSALKNTIIEMITNNIFIYEGESFHYLPKLDTFVECTKLHVLFHMEKKCI